MRELKLQQLSKEFVLLNSTRKSIQDKSLKTFNQTDNGRHLATTLWSLQSKAQSNSETPHLAERTTQPRSGFPANF